MVEYSLLVTADIAGICWYKLQAIAHKAAIFAGIQAVKWG